MTAERSTAPVADVEALSRNAGLMTEQFSRALAAYAKPLEDGKPNTALAESVTEVVRTLAPWPRSGSPTPEGDGGPELIGGQFLALWGSTLQRMQGETVTPVALPDPKDKRFAAPEWSSNPVFDFLKQAT